jgi:hypothetical protein
MGAEKSGVGAVSIRRRQAIVRSEGLSLGDVGTRPVSIMGTGRQQTVHQTRRGSHCSGADQIDPFGRHIGRIAK